MEYTSTRMQNMFYIVNYMYVYYVLLYMCIHKIYEYVCVCLYIMCMIITFHALIAKKRMFHASDAMWWDSSAPERGRFAEVGREEAEPPGHSSASQKLPRNEKKSIEIMFHVETSSKKTDHQLENVNQL